MEDIWDPFGYRPVALTSCVSRIIERLLNEQLARHIESKGLLLEECHGFVGSRGCATAVLDILMELTEAIEEGSVSTLLGVDISCAFDCLSKSKLQT